jgi:hypothetical protein
LLRFDDQMFIKYSERQIERQIERKIDGQTEKKNRRAKIINKLTALPWHKQTDIKTDGQNYKQTLKKLTTLP